MRIARRAGIKHAKIATLSNSTTTSANVIGSVGFTSKSMLAGKRVSASEATTPRTVPTGPAMAQNKKNDCRHPLKILSQPKFSNEDRSKWKGTSVTGRVDEGDVTQARVVAASPKEAAESLLNAAKQAKFAPRHGWDMQPTLRQRGPRVRIGQGVVPSEDLP
jgi:hypothetical protein